MQERSKQRLQSLQEVADFLGVPASTLYRWRHEGRGPASIKVGRVVRYRPEDVDAWLQANSHQPAPAA